MRPCEEENRLDSDVNKYSAVEDETELKYLDYSFTFFSVRAFLDIYFGTPHGTKIPASHIL